MSSDMQSAKVSVLIPVYNSERYLSRCLDSVLCQTYGNVEAICVDDGSSDASPGILDDYARTNPERIVVEHRKNAGAAAARNRAIELARGEYIAFLDNDDWLDLDFLEVLVGVAKKHEAQVVCSGYRRSDENGNVSIELAPKSSDEWGRYMVEAAWAKLYRADYVRANGLRFLPTNIDEDLYFSLPAVELASRCIVTEYCGYNWFWNSTSVSNTGQRFSAKLQFEETLNAILSMMRQKEIPMTPILRHYFVRLIVWFLLYTRKGDGHERSRRNYGHYVEWLDCEIENWRDEPYASPFHPTGDPLTNRLAVWLFARHRLVFSAALTLYGLIG